MLDTIVLRLHTHVLLQNQHLKKVGSLCIGSYIQDNFWEKKIFNLWKFWQESKNKNSVCIKILLQALSHSLANWVTHKQIELLTNKLSHSQTNWVTHKQIESLIKLTYWVTQNQNWVTHEQIESLMNKCESLITNVSHS